MHRLLLLFLVILISGCTTSKAIRTPVKNSISIETAKEAKHTGNQVRWGGIVVGLTNKSNVSIIEIVERPLTHFGVPKITNKTGGRFLAKSQEFLDPENFITGRYITIHGTLEAYQTGKIGDYDYEYPVIAIHEYKLWPAQNFAPYRHYNTYYYDPFWWHHPYSFGHRRFRRHAW